LHRAGYHYLVTEAPLSAGEPRFSARYGVIETVRQLHQLLLAAYGLHRPAIRAWRRRDGRFIDPLRPTLFPAGFASEDDVAQARHTHLAAVRRVFQTCNVFLFTLGGTEAWLAADGTAAPASPDAAGVQPPEGGGAAHQFSVAEMRQDIDGLLADLFAVNADLRVLLTVSPAPAAGAGSPLGSLMANTYSKAALRVVAEEAVRAHARVDYFPAYDVLTAPGAGDSYIDAESGAVSAQGMEQVLRLFDLHALARGAGVTA
jgi:hypothetical protein